MAGPVSDNTALEEADDESLMRALQSGNHQAFSLLVRRYSPRFYAAAWRLSGNSGEAEDLVQEAFLKVWHKPHMWNPDGGAAFTTWFYRVLVNLAIDKKRRRRPQLAGEEIIETLRDTRAAQDEVMILSEEQRLLEAGLAALPERQRTALTLCFYEGLSNAQAAEVMGVKVKALESLLMRAKAGIKDFVTQAQDTVLSSPKGGRYAR